MRYIRFLLRWIVAIGGITCWLLCSIFVFALYIKDAYVISYWIGLSVQLVMWANEPIKEKYN